MLRHKFDTFTDSEPKSAVARGELGLGDGVPGPGMHLLTEPFARDDLAGRVRHLIEER